ncbi:MAG: Zn-ribbon domain-containing OB-fold protein [Anaerolineales bacterium]|nr:Zn-ribbon domain-containing OB-fold protein [Anaerolineales bacterium]
MDRNLDPDRLLDPHWFIQPLDINHPQLAGSRCEVCGAVLFPIREFCSSCGRRSSMKTIPLGRSGVLYSFSVAYVSPAGFDPPYAFGYVQLEQGLRLFSRLVDCDPPESLEIGTSLELTLAPIRNDREGFPLWGYAYRPAVSCHCDTCTGKRRWERSDEAISGSNVRSDDYSACEGGEAISHSGEELPCGK